MKKLLLILLFLLIPCMVFSQTFDVGADASVSWLTEWECYMVNMDVAFFINPEGWINGTLFGGIEVLMDVAGEAGFIAFAPYSDRYNIGGAFNLDVFYVSVTHYCIHPVWSGYSQFYENWYTENCTKFTVGMKKNMPYKVNKRGR